MNVWGASQILYTENLVSMDWFNSLQASGEIRKLNGPGGGAEV